MKKNNSLKKISIEYIDTNGSVKIYHDLFLTQIRLHLNNKQIINPPEIRNNLWQP